MSQKAIKKALFQMSLEKSPGHDSFNDSFY